MNNHPPRWPLGNTNIGRILSIINDGNPSVNFLMNDFSSIINEASVLNNSLYDQPPVKNVISNKGKQQLKTIKYVENCCNNSKCPILHIDFDEDEKITVLPCNHGFNTEAINRWLSDEKAECPVCRFKLESIEKKNTSTDNNNQQTSPVNIPPLNNISSSLYDILTPTNSFTSRHGTSTVFYSHPYGPRIDRVATIISEDDDEDDLMRAIGHVHDLNNDRSIQRTAIYTSRIFDVINHLHDSSDNDFQVD